jgi:hypothetical protein
MKSAVVFAAIGLGLLLLMLSGLWATLFPAKASWTEEKADRWREVKSQIYNLSFTINRPNRMHGGQDAGAAMAEYKALQKENDELTAEFESAAARPNTVSKLLKWTGIALTVIGVIGWYSVKNTS